VAREVLEEASVRVEDVHYRSSQPWPFPASLMLGFHARYAAGEPSVGDGELDDVRWFERGELAAIARGEVEGMHVPPPLAIARRLIDEWLLAAQSGPLR
jgi:NAD+ diphosphatase